MSIRLIGSLLLVLVVLLTPRYGKAQEDAAIEACFSAYEETQVRLKAHEYEKARELARSCSSGCPREISEQCQTWSWEAERDAPSVILVARYESGEDAPGVSAAIDGQWRALQKEVLLDPGTHEITFTKEDGWSYSVSVKIHPGEKRRTIRASVPKPRDDAPPPPEVELPTPKRHLPWAVTSFSVGAVGFGVAGVFTGLALTQKRDLDQCAPACDERDVARAHDLLTVADVGLVVGAVGLATGIGILIWGKPDKKNASLSLTGAPKALSAGVRGSF